MNGENILLIYLLCSYTEEYILLGLFKLGTK